MYGLDSKKSSLSWQWPKAKVPWGTSKDGGLRWNDEGQKQQQPQPPRRKRYCRLNNIGTICRWQNQFCRGELQTSKMVIQILAVQVQPFGSDRWERHWVSIGICEKIKNFQLLLISFSYSSILFDYKIGDGVIDHEEFEYVLSEFGVSERMARQAFTIFTQVGQNICISK